MKIIIPLVACVACVSASYGSVPWSQYVQQYPGQPYAGQYGNPYLGQYTGNQYPAGQPYAPYGGQYGNQYGDGQYPPSGSSNIGSYYDPNNNPPPPHCVSTPIVYVNSQYTAPNAASLGSSPYMPGPLLTQDQINMFALNPAVPKPPVYYQQYSPQWNQWYQQQYQMMYGAATDPYANQQAFNSCMTCAGQMGSVPAYNTQSQP